MTASRPVPTGVFAGLVIVALVLTGCGGPPPVGPSATPSSTASPTPSGGTTPTDSGLGSAGDCPLPAFTLALPRKRLVAATVQSGAGIDGLVFSLGGPPAAGARLEISSAAPPYSRAGQALDIEGDRVVELRFVGVETADAAGVRTFLGSRDLEPDRPAIRRLTVFDEADGLIAWYLGLAGSGCLTAGVRGDDGVLLVVIHDP